MKSKRKSKSSTQVRVSWGSSKAFVPSVEVPSSKSELNRMLILSALRKGPTEILGKNSCEDVTKMIQSLSTLGVSISETEKGYQILPSSLLEKTDEFTLDCGSGGTTLRFLMGLASARPGKTNFQMTSQLMKRPIQQWLEVLKSLGVQIEELPNGFSIVGNHSWPNQIIVPVHQSSQFVSSLALICSGLDHPSQLIFKGPAVSQSYFSLTLEILRLLGTTIETNSEGVWITPPFVDQQTQPLTITAEGDASSAAVWLAAGGLGWPIAVSNYPSSQRQADTQLTQILPLFSCSCSQQDVGRMCSPSLGSGYETRRICLTDSPDLAPILGVLAVLLPGKTILYGAEHLRFKESNRIENFPQMLMQLGLTIETRPDGLEGKGPQNPTPGVLPTFGDHRLAMAGSLCASRTDYVVIENPEVVNKSYPQFWDHAQSVGWKVEKEGPD